MSFVKYTYVICQGIKLSLPGYRVIMYQVIGLLSTRLSVRFGCILSGYRDVISQEYRVVICQAIGLVIIYRG